MMAADYRHIGGRENRLGRHYSRFSPFWPTPALSGQSLALRKLCDAGSNRRSQAKALTASSNFALPVSRGRARCFPVRAWLPQSRVRINIAYGKSLRPWPHEQGNYPDVCTSPSIFEEKRIGTITKYLMVDRR